MIDLFGRPRGIAALATVSALVAAAPAVRAADEVRAFDIRAQSLSAALLEYSRQSDVLVIVDPKLVAGKSTAALQGRFTAPDALQRLLAGSGLASRQTPEGGIVLTSEGTARPSQLGAADPATSSAQQDVPEAGRESAVLIEEIIVTAEKREENLQRVPVAVTALTRTLRESIGLVYAQDIYNFTPGATLGGGDRLSIRGIGRLTTVIGTDSGVAIYSNGFYGVSNSEVGLSPLMTERVEVLRGPQGTLYGRNSIGGAVNVISRRPSEDLELEGRAIAGDYERTQVEFRVSGPLSEHIRGSVGGFALNQDEGFYENTAGGPSEGARDQQLFGEVQLAFDVGPSFDGWFRWFVADTDQHPRGGAMISPYDTTSIGGATINPAFLQTEVNPSVNDHSKFATDTPARMQLENNHFAVLELTNRFGWAQLRYLGGYSQYDFSMVQDGDGTPFSTVVVPGLGTYFPKQVTVIGDSKETWSQELTLTSTHDGPLQWLVGLYYFHEVQDQAFDQTVPQQPEFYTPYLPSPFPAPPSPFAVRAPDNPLAATLSSFSSLKTESKAIYSQLDYELSEEWSFTLGARYSEDDKEGRETLRFVQFDFFTNPFVPVALDRTFGPQSRELADDWGGYTGTTSVQWSPSDDVMGYAKYSRGFKSGGINLGTGAVEPYVDEETVDAFELGWKQMLGASLRMNGALFYNFYDGAQAPVDVPISDVAKLSTLVNLDDVRTYGAELEAIWAVTRDLSVLLNYSYLSAKIEKGCCFIDPADPDAMQPGAHPTGQPGGDGQDLHGNTMPRAPENKAALNVSYRMDFAGGNLILSGTHTWQDQTYYSIFNTPDWLAPDAHQTNFRATWSQAKGPLTLVASLNNAFDEEALIDVGTSAPPARYRSIAVMSPRTWALEARVKF